MAGRRQAVRQAEFAVASGIFNVKGNIPIETWTRYVRETIDMIAAARLYGFGFNMLRLSSDQNGAGPTSIMPIQCGYCA